MEIFYKKYLVQIFNRKTFSRPSRKTKFLTSSLRRKDLRLILYREKTFYRSPIEKKCSGFSTEKRLIWVFYKKITYTCLLQRGELLQVFCRKNTFCLSSTEKRSFTGFLQKKSFSSFLQIENLLQVFFKKKILHMSSIERSSQQVFYREKILKRASIKQTLENLLRSERFLQVFW